MASFRTLAVKEWVTGQFVPVLVACSIAGCGTGSLSGIPTPGPPRAPLPTLVPGAPTPIPPRFPPPATLTPTPTPVMMTFTFRNACAAAQVARLRLFDETLDLIFLDDRHDYIIAAIPAQISIGCRAGNEICYGGQLVSLGPTPSPTPSPILSTTPATTPQPTPNFASTFGVGLNNDRPCANCCFTCAEATIPRIDLRCTLP
jgi:hypothetical protein